MLPVQERSWSISLTKQRSLVFSYSRSKDCLSVKSSDAKGLLLAAIEDPNPVMVFEHKALYRSLSGEVSSDYYTTPIGVAKLVEVGEDLSIITYGMGVHWAKSAIKKLNVKADILDLRTLLPLDKESIFKTVKKTK